MEQHPATEPAQDEAKILLGGPQCEGCAPEEAQKAADQFTAGCETDVILKEFRDGYLPYDGGKVKDFFEELKDTNQPRPHLHALEWRRASGSSVGQ